jgi:hypothetical protein
VIYDEAAVITPDLHFPIFFCFLTHFTTVSQLRKRNTVDCKIINTQVKMGPCEVSSLMKCYIFSAGK